MGNKTGISIGVVMTKLEGARARLQRLEELFQGESILYRVSLYLQNATTQARFYGREVDALELEHAHNCVYVAFRALVAEGKELCSQCGH